MYSNFKRLRKSEETFNRVKEFNFNANHDLIKKNTDLNLAKLYNNLISVASTQLRARNIEEGTNFPNSVKAFESFKLSQFLNFIELFFDRTCIFNHCTANNLINTKASRFYYFNPI